MSNNYNILKFLFTFGTENANFRVNPKERGNEGDKVEKETGESFLGTVYHISPALLTPIELWNNHLAGLPRPPQLLAGGSAIVPHLARRDKRHDVHQSDS